MTKSIMDEALDEVKRSGRLRIQEKVFAKMQKDDPIADLVSRFSAALLEKLRAAENKYGRKDDWLAPNWEAECQQQLLEHVAKGDPRDVAAYCAFAWYHGWTTAVTPAQPQRSAASEHSAQYIIEGIILRRLHEKRIDGYTLEMSKEIAAALTSTEPQGAAVREALEIAEDVLSRTPFSTAILPNGMHPQVVIEKIRAALAMSRPVSR
ncbi:hypothetical protein IVB43_23695 [Bradyrhizobium sp. 48]|uniref:hypothetical protein n=1 Tax=Bradyrhizobium sp. 48 TaxID=2782676 RepID=UPI001FF82D96|nr:hypothetical protein [Bradyrhizobium sp. 48]MCK1445392.1 hypothetical protein [Bradyrhizobium sp. 48]